MVSKELEIATLEVLNPAYKIYLSQIYRLKGKGRIFRQIASSVQYFGPLRPTQFPLGHCELYANDGYRVVDLGMETAVATPLAANESLLSVNMASCTGVGIKFTTDDAEPRFCLAHFSSYFLNASKNLIEQLREGRYRVSGLAITTPVYNQKDAKELIKWINSPKGQEIPTTTDYREAKETASGGLIVTAGGGVILEDNPHPSRPYMPKKRWSW